MNILFLYLNKSYCFVFKIKKEIDIYFYYEPFIPQALQNIVPTSIVSSRFLHFSHNYKIRSKNSSVSLFFYQFDLAYNFLLTTFIYGIRQRTKKKKFKFF